MDPSKVPGRGWNDPPNLPPMMGSAPPTGTSAPPKRSAINLNKRVAFPLSTPAAGAGGSATTAAGPIMNANLPPQAPPKIQCLPLKVISTQNIPQNDDSEANNLSADFDRESGYHKMLENLEILISESTNLEHKNDIERRFEDMKKMWRDDQLDSKLCQTLLQLSEALLKRDIDSANFLQLAAVSSWPSETCKFAAAFRCLVNYFRPPVVNPSFTEEPGMVDQVGNSEN